MFGYVCVNRKELSEENVQIYQSYYCGLCRCLKDCCGSKGQLLLNYDMTFLILLLTGLYEEESTQTSFRCRLHPIKKRELFINDISQYAADMNVLLAYQNLMDDWKDEKNHLKHGLAMALKKDYEEIAERYPRQVGAIEAYIEKQGQLEKQQEENIDLVAGLTGEMLGELLVWKEDEWQQELRRLGLYLGKFIYLMDAYEDLEKDRKSGNYNPLLRIANEEELEFEVMCKRMMTGFMAECAKSFERLPILMHGDIIRNILYSGVWSRYERIRWAR